MSNCGCKSSSSIKVTPDTCCKKVTTTCQDSSASSSPCTPSGTVNHFAPVVQNTFSPFLKSSGRSIFPDTDKTNLLKFPDVSKILAGSVLWSESIGYIEIVSWDNINKLATFKNSEVFGPNQVIESGEYIPDCTEWIITAPVAPSSSESASSCYLAKDYVVPALSSSAVAVFNSTDCFSAGDFIRIDGTALKVVSVISSTQANLSNEASEVDALKEITAEDCGKLLHKVVVIGEESPCENEVVTADGVQVIEDADTCKKGIIKPTAKNQVLISNSQNEFVLGNLPDLDPETTFEGCVTLNPALDPQEYPLTVDNVDDFQVKDIVYFSCDDADPAREFEIVDITDSVVTLTPLFEVSAVELISTECEGCLMVSAGCCRRVEERLECVIEQVGSTSIVTPINKINAPTITLGGTGDFDGDLTQQVYLNNALSYVQSGAGGITSANLPSFTYNNSASEVDVILEIHTSVRFGYDSVVYGMRMDFEVVISDDAFATFDLDNDLLAQSPASQVLADLGSILNVDAGASAEIAGQQNLTKSVFYTVPAGESVTFHVLSRALYNNEGTGTAENVGTGDVRLNWTEIRYKASPATNVTNC